VIELIAKIGFFLAVAMLIGMGIGWFVADIMRKKSILLETKSLKSTIQERDKQLKLLEENLSIQKTQLFKMTDEGIVSRHNLLKQSNMIRKQSDELFMIQDKLGQIKVMEQDKAECLKGIMELSLQLKEREEELSTYEKKYLLSKKNTQLKTAINISEERTLKESSFKESSFKESALKQEVEELKLLLAESHLKLSDEDMIISKDQFKHIEKEFVVYKEKIELLKKENKELNYLLKNSQQKSNGVIEKLTAFIPFKSDNPKNIDIKFQKQQKIKQV
jgi:hypothetical protein